MKAEKDIRRQIAGDRRKRVERLGAEEGFPVPAVRQVPLVPFDADPLLICEVKRRSPSRGAIKEIPRAEEQARLYRDRGASRISVLTEPDWFGGSLQDLMDVKRAYPDLSVLRKDFLLTPEDIEVSFRAGADACLLIASLLPEVELKIMHDLCAEKGMTPLVEVHSEEDVLKAEKVRPSLVGINSRNLKDFRIYPLQPLKIRSLIRRDCRIVYESGILSETDGLFAAEAGFSGLLVGEGVVRDPDLIDGLKKVLAAHAGPPGINPWVKLCRRWKSGRPLVKVCGLTRREDYDRAVSLGADLCGFILAPSLRRTTGRFICSLPASSVLKVGVVVLKREEALPAEVKALLDEGYLDMIQFHGSENPPSVRGKGYKALRIRSEEDLDRMEAYRPLPCLLDAFSPAAAGGTGKRICPELTGRARERGELWLAGGLNPENIREILKAYSPELVDLSSGLEAAPGIKDHRKMEDFFKEIHNYAGI